MEFLLTYGWAITIVVVIVAGLAYFGGFDMKKTALAALPPSCVIDESGLSCLDHSVTFVAHPSGQPERAQNNLYLRLKNNLGRTITIEEMAVPEYGIEWGDRQIFNANQWLNGQGAGKDDPILQVPDITGENPAIGKNQAYEIEFILKVVHEDTKLTHFYKGSIRGKVD